MKRFGWIICLILILTPFPAAVAQDESPKSEDEEESLLILPAGTPINLVMLERLYSQRNREGDEIVFALSEDIVVMGQTYLCAGTPVIGRVIGAKPAKSWGRQGTLDIEIFTISPLYSMPIPVTAEFKEGGGSKKTTSIATTALLGITVIGLFAGGSISGSGAVIESGSIITVFTAEDGTIRDIPEDEMRTLVEEWYTAKVVRSFLNYRWDKKRTIGAAMDSLGYTIDESMITIEEQENYHYSVYVQISPTQTADFVFQPFEEPHIGKFITLEANNDLAKRIMKAVK